MAVIFCMFKSAPLECITTREKCLTQTCHEMNLIHESVCAKTHRVWKTEKEVGDGEYVCKTQWDSTKLGWLCSSGLWPFCLSAAFPPTLSFLMVKTNVPLYNQLLHLTLLTSDLSPWPLGHATPTARTPWHFSWIKDPFNSRVRVQLSDWVWVHAPHICVLTCSALFHSIRLHRLHGRQRENTSKPQWGK